MPSLSRIVLGGFFLLAGALHFLKPRPYEAIMPEALPAHRELVYWIWRVAVRGATSGATRR